MLSKPGLWLLHFAQCGPIEPRFADIYDDWLARGANAGMDYMDRYRDIRNDPRLLLEGAMSMLCCAFPYGQSAEDRCELFSDYAVGDDYHEVLRRRLEPVATLMQQIAPGSNTRICIDTAPLRERYWTMRAGVGFIGINNQLIVPGIGSKVFWPRFCGQPRQNTEALSPTAAHIAADA